MADKDLAIHVDVVLGGHQREHLLLQVVPLRLCLPIPLGGVRFGAAACRNRWRVVTAPAVLRRLAIGRASRTDSRCQEVCIWVVVVELQDKYSKYKNKKI